MVIIIGSCSFLRRSPAAAETPALSQQADTTDLTLPAGDDPVLNNSPTELTTAETAPRIAIETDRLNGSISLKGGRIDDLSLLDYRVDLSEGSPDVTLLKPVEEPGAYYAAFGWAGLSGLQPGDTPTPETLWAVDGKPHCASMRRSLVQSPADLFRRRFGG